jgi:threonine dehydrogenase-like Zn-dependent dehydrogenase
VVVLGNVTRLDGVDWTPLWFKELTLRGSLCYGREPHAAAGPDAFRQALELIASGRAPVGALLTHTFPLAEHRRAVALALDKRAGHCIKVAFRVG